MCYKKTISDRGKLRNLKSLYKNLNKSIRQIMIGPNRIQAATSYVNGFKHTHIDQKRENSKSYIFTRSLLVTSQTYDLFTYDRLLVCPLKTNIDVTLVKAEPQRLQQCIFLSIVARRFWAPGGKGVGRATPSAPPSHSHFSTCP
jgi:hypothetical protein